MKFHVEHNVTPKHFEAIIPLFYYNPCLTSANIYEELSERGHKINQNYLSKNIKVLILFNILTVSDDNFKYLSLTPFGKKMLHLIQYNKKKFYDICHYLYYTSYQLKPTNAMGFSWTYQAITNYLWETIPKTCDEVNIVNKILDLAQTTFPDNQISLSHWAVSGVRNWLNQLDPPFIVTSNKFRSIKRRSFCSPELFLLAIDYYYKNNKNNYGTPIIINDINKEFISKLCLLDLNAFNNMLDLTKSIYPQIHKENSIWGTSISICEPIDLINIV